ncbi:hypothetical protein FA13DRAFT_317349 [Coprinellus micaceus]|uniref:Uncharacterized protein n=1 Tax=Coprinellus micaceus TaxID=71717 RepID=A0A4Y7TEM3_COPMI|nr:hypothetical protein FA13DRAFT_317349 [Coprinellus micaceus]
MSPYISGHSILAESFPCLLLSAVLRGLLRVKKNRYLKEKFVHTTTTTAVNPSSGVPHHPKTRNLEYPLYWMPGPPWLASTDRLPQPHLSPALVFSLFIVSPLGLLLCDRILCICCELHPAIHRCTAYDSYYPYSHLGCLDAVRSMSLGEAPPL